ncbi:MAG: polysaccharide lyase, partial [Pirellulales bacterium]|nr:polysaccharide lyase [Pirellulales bacterium]
MRRVLLRLVVLSFVLASVPAIAGQGIPVDRREALDALRKATEFFRTKVSTEGGYLWTYSEDLSHRRGEGAATDTMVWVQTPGTPAVGMALLRAHEATSDPYYLDAARQAGYCLVRGQLRSGGWAYSIEFNPEKRARYAYRVDKIPDEEKASQENTTTLDDANTQGALAFLVQLDKALGFRDEKIHEVVRYGLERLLAVQYPNGAWPQRFTKPRNPREYPVKKASYPVSWSREHPREKYSAYYTFNDGAITSAIRLMLQASAVYDDPRYEASARRGGDFILLAQMPEPQPAWAQQYDAQMHPAWARRFEPPSVTGGESLGILHTLLALYRWTGKKDYLAPVPRTLDYFEQSTLPDGTLARFYELKTNRPLFFTREYELTYNDDDLPTHYCFKLRTS